MQVSNQFIAVGFLFFVHYVHLASSTFCDESTIPLQLKISSNGLLQLKCSKPSCFNDEAEKSHKKTICFDAPWTTSCADSQQWFSGIEHNGLVKCCWNEKMKHVKSVAELMMFPTDEFNGSEVFDINNQSVFYNVISNVRKIEERDGKVHYGVTVSRISCPLDPPEVINKVANNFHTSLIGNLSRKGPRLPKIDLSYEDEQRNLQIPESEVEIDEAEDKSAASELPEPLEENEFPESREEIKLPESREEIKLPESREEIELPSIQLPPRKGGYRLSSESQAVTPQRRPVHISSPRARSRGVKRKLSDPITVSPDTSLYDNEETTEDGKDFHVPSEISEPRHESEPESHEDIPEERPVHKPPLQARPRGSLLNPFTVLPDSSVYDDDKEIAGRGQGAFHYHYTHQFSFRFPRSFEHP